VNVVEESVIVEIGIDVVIVVNSLLVMVEEVSVGKLLLPVPDELGVWEGEGEEPDWLFELEEREEELDSVPEGINVEPPLVVHHNCGNVGSSEDIISSSESAPGLILDEFRVQRPSSLSGRQKS
jgi:hypothetical protein